MAECMLHAAAGADESMHLTVEWSSRCIYFQAAGYEIYRVALLWQSIHLNNKQAAALSTNFSSKPTTAADIQQAFIADGIALSWPHASYCRRRCFFMSALRTQRRNCRQGSGRGDKKTDARNHSETPPAYRVLCHVFTVVR